MTYQSKTQGMAHQLEARRQIAARPSSPSAADIFALMMEYGTGKSWVICDEFGEREDAGDLQDLLVVAGAGSYRNWSIDKNEDQLAEFRTHMSDDLFERLRVGTWVAGGSAGVRRQMENLLRSPDPRRPRALLMNVESISSVQRARDLCREFLGTPGRRAMTVVDESTLIKAPSKRTGHMLHFAGQSDARRILTGLITPNSPMDLYTQFEFLDWRVLGHQSFYSFQSKYAVIKKLNVRIPGASNPDGSPRTRSVRVETGYRELEDLNQRIAPYSYRVLKDECMDLPPKVYAPIQEVEMTSEQVRIYRELREFALAELNAQDFITAPLAITRMLRLQQVLCGHVTDADGVEHDIPSNRGASLLEVLAQTQGKAIIWAPFQRTINKIIALLEKEYGPGSMAEFTGRNKTTRHEDEARFLGDPGCRFMVSTPAAGGRGNTWNVASLVVYFANTYDLELRLNSEDRPHRKGQDKSVTYVDLACPGTVEDKQVKALRAKIDIATAIMGDGYKAWLV